MRENASPQLHPALVLFGKRGSPNGDRRQLHPRTLACARFKLIQFFARSLGWPESSAAFLFAPRRYHLLLTHLICHFLSFSSCVIIRSAGHSGISNRHRFSTRSSQHFDLRLQISDSSSLPVQVDIRKNYCPYHRGGNTHNGTERCSQWDHQLP